MKFVVEVVCSGRSARNRRAAQSYNEAQLRE